MKIYDALQLALAQATEFFSLCLAALVRAQQDYVSSLLFRAVKHKDLMMWKFLLEVFGSPDLVVYYAALACCGVPLVDYVD